MTTDYHSLCVKAVDSIRATEFALFCNQAPKPSAVEKLITSWKAERSRVFLEGLSKEEIQAMSFQAKNTEALQTLVQIALNKPSHLPSIQETV